MKNKVTINDIAKLTNVSKATVSFYLNGKFDKMSESTRANIAKAIEKTQYKPSVVARSLNNKNTKLIGVIIGDITNTFANQIVKGIEDYALENDYQLLVGSSKYDLEIERKYIKGMLAMGVDGFVVQPTIGFESMWNELDHGSKPIVYFDSPNRDTKGRWVKTNNYEAVYEACDLLVKRGYEEFILVTANPYVLTTRLERNRGFTDNLDIKKLPYHVVIADDETSTEKLQELLFPYLHSDKKVCVFACNNWLLSKVYVAMKPVSHKIPESIGIIGFDSLEWSELTSPSITTIVQPAYEEGYNAGKILIDAIEDRNEEAPNQILKCRINECDSTKRNSM